VLRYGQQVILKDFHMTYAFGGIIAGRVSDRLSDVKHNGFVIEMVTNENGLRTLYPGSVTYVMQGVSFPFKIKSAGVYPI